MRFIIVVIIIAIVAGGLYFTSQNPKQTSQIKPQTEKQIGSSKITAEEAVTSIKNLPEVQEYLKNVPNGKVEIDNELEGEYNVHVYEVKNGHTATFNWYRVSIRDGKIKEQFPTGKESNSPKF